jgi:hypothetical protein
MRNSVRNVNSFRRVTEIKTRHIKAEEKILTRGKEHGCHQG